MTFEKFVEIFLSSFFGAFAAYVFMQLSQLSIMRSDRFSKYLNALLAAERFIGNTINSLKNNEEAIKNYIKVIKERKLFHPLLLVSELDRSIFHYILNIELYNDVNYAFDHISHYNVNVRDFESKYLEVKAMAYKTDKKSIDMYLRNIEFSILPNLVSLNKYQNDLCEHLILTNAKINVFQVIYRTSNLKYRFHAFIYGNSYNKPKNYDELVERKLKELKLQGEEIMRKTKGHVA
ncbi:hypothetical protein [Leptospira noguchii]|uniref:hypothetical protein n=1 Tax=Leptospira noguchii TaxID=28182 RepID=UPI000328726F|nr:hypothetical protein [Leptospira noguchii]EMS86184.1 hypothetical protein LEP1GSC074_0629 [Leptospira noguchii str. Hook]